MFQGWILFLNEIYSDLIKLEVPIFAILAGLVTAFVTVWLERLKDQKEKLQDRKDMWLDDHWRSLIIDLKDISKIKIIDLCGYNIDNSGFAPYCRIELYKGDYISPFSHIESGYSELYNLLENIFSDEKRYHDKMSKYLNDIYLDITTFMKEVFPHLNKRIGSNDNLKRHNISSGEESYDVSSFLTELINSIEGGSYYLSEVNTNEIYCVDVKTNEHDPSTIASSKEPILPKFEKEIWSRLMTKYEKIVKELQVEQKKIIDEESQWNNSIQDIIVTYKIGFSIKGKCKDCEKILSEKKIINIRPPEINK